MKVVAAILTFTGGLYFFLEFLLPETMTIDGDAYTFGKYHQEISLSLALISSLAVGLGVINILLVHGRNLLRGGKAWSSSLGLFLSFFVTLYVLFFHWLSSVQTLSKWDSLQALSNYIENVTKDEKLPSKEEQIKIGKNLSLLVTSDLVKDEYWGAQVKEELASLSSRYDEVVSSKEDAEVTSKYFSSISVELLKIKKNGIEQYDLLEKSSNLALQETFLLDALFFPLGLSMFSILGFYVVSAAYRSFRVRSIESAILMATALVVILGQIPQGVMYVSKDLPAIRLWLFDYISTPAFRAIYFTSVIAGLSLAVRMWLSLDKNPFLSRSK